MDISRYDNTDPADVLAVESERLTWPERVADSANFWVAVDCLRADEHPATEAPLRECVTDDGSWIQLDPHLFSEEMTGELWTNRAVTDPEDEA